MKKILLFFSLLLLPFLVLHAVSSDDVNYTVEEINIIGNIEMSGGVNFKEIIKIDGTYNGYIRDIVYKNDKLQKFTGIKEDFTGSDIYNGTSVEIKTVGILDVENFQIKDYTDEYIEKNLKKFTEEGKGKYELTDIDNGKSIKMYNETIKGSTYFYLDYTVLDVAVKHNDYAEFYYSIIGDTFDDEIKNLLAIVYTPFPDSESLKVWAHGPVNGEVSLLENGYGAVLKIQNLKANTPVDLRMTFDRELYSISLNPDKITDIDALPFILEVEEKRAENANEIRNNARISLYIIVGIDILYLIFLIVLFIMTYIKFDKEYVSSFLNKYNREFIDDYDVEIIDYLMKKSITTNAFSASILNLIYKKKISVLELKEKKKSDYEFTLITEEGTSENEKLIIDLLFKQIGSNNKVKMSDITKESKIITDGQNRIYNCYNSWNLCVKDTARTQEFFINNKKTKALLSLYSIIGIIICFGLYQYYGTITKILMIITFAITFVFLIYVLTFSKRTMKGNEHYNKWKSFEKFLKDFGRFQDKELPEIALWERYLVYATIFGLADKVSKEMRIKFQDMNVSNTTYMPQYYMFNIGDSISRDINNSVTKSISTVNTYEAAQSRDSSGSGFGGGFSSGGGFAGGGGGGRGF